MDGSSDSGEYDLRGVTSLDPGSSDKDLAHKRNSVSKSVVATPRGRRGYQKLESEMQERYPYLFSI